MAEGAISDAGAERIAPSCGTYHSRRNALALIAPYGYFHFARKKRGSSSA